MSRETRAPSLAEPASLKFAMFRDGLAEFTTMVVERTYNATVTAGVWQDGSPRRHVDVWQTNETGGFCTDTTFLHLRRVQDAVPDGAMIGLQVGDRDRHPGEDVVCRRISLTIGGTTDTWDFELPAADASDAVIGSATVDRHRRRRVDRPVRLRPVRRASWCSRSRSRVRRRRPMTLDPGETDVDHGQRAVRHDGHQRVLTARTPSSRPRPSRQRPLRRPRRPRPPSRRHRPPTPSSSPAQPGPPTPDRSSSSSAWSAWSRCSWHPPGGRARIAERHLLREGV